MKMKLLMSALSEVLLPMGLSRPHVLALSERVAMMHPLAGLEKDVYSWRSTEKEKVSRDARIGWGCKTQSQNCAPWLGKGPVKVMGTRAVQHTDQERRTGGSPLGKLLQQLRDESLRRRCVHHFGLVPLSRGVKSCLGMFQFVHLALNAHDDPRNRSLSVGCGYPHWWSTEGSC